MAFLKTVQLLVLSVLNNTCDSVKAITSINFKFTCKSKFTWFCLLEHVKRIYIEFQALIQYLMSDSVVD